MRLAGLESQAQGLARPEQMLLTNHLVRRSRPQLLGQRRAGRQSLWLLQKQIAQNRILTGNTPSIAPVYRQTLLGYAFLHETKR